MGKLLKAVFRRIFVHNFYLKFVAAVLTLALYIWVSEDRETVVTGQAPVRVVVPEEMVLVSVPVEQVRVMIQGRWSDINRFDPSQLDPIRIDLTRAQRDTVVQISPDMVRVPPNLRVLSVEPNHMLVELEPEASKTVPIVARVVGEPRRAYVVEGVRVNPERITVRGPESTVELVNAIPTERIDVSGRAQSFQKQVRLRPEEPLISWNVDQPISVVVDISTEESTRTFEDIPVVAVNTTHPTEIRPSTTDITVRGPKEVIERMRIEVVRPELDLAEEDERPSGTFSKEVIVRNLPPDVTLVRVYPSSFQVTMSPRD